MPKISVIMPVYNGELFLQPAIDSLLVQSETDWELIVVDDGSKDRTPQLLESYADERIKVFRQANQGEAGARNAGLQQATGEYIAFLDADDLYLPKALEDLRSYLDSHPQFDVVFSDGDIFNEHDQVVMSLTDVRPGIHTGRILDKVIISSSIVTVPVCTMTRRSKILAHSVQFDRNVVIGPDWDFWIQLAAHVDFGYLDKKTCRYRIHTTNISRTTGSEKRRKDELYRRMKILNAEWFGSLPLASRELFFLDSITRALAGDTERQEQLLRSQQCSQLSPSKQASLWRMTAIDALKSRCDSLQVNSYLQESLKLNPADRKTQSLQWAMRMGQPLALALVNTWHLGVWGRKKLRSIRPSRTERLQRLLGIK